MKKAFILSAAAAVGLFTFGGVQQASAKEFSFQHVVTVKTGNMVQNMSLNDVMKKLHINTNIKTLNAANEKEIKQLLKKHAKQSNMNIQDVQKTETAKPVQKTAEKAAAEQNTASKAPAPTQQNAASKAPAAAEKTNTTTSAPSSVSAYEKKVVELTNAERQKQGLKPLQIDETLSKSARAKSQDMKDKNYFDHQSPTYGSPFDMMKSFGISYKTAGENIAKGQKTPEEVVKAWMNSEGHRKNILNPNFTHIGVGYVESGSIWTQQFIGK
ncbi:CAP domain-containing protein [Bacillus sp. C28GYM-DRY-1]|uniref:CAP domain-containing protein n=1 Tax=Bacillus sp. C28GYM-DRY-1 TaxID=3062686 RepID=UPI0026748BE1|nr:CAP domain-containing protein [Bacillus sp. C28GYM-DRY-1]MDO3662970.1 CAP domain-containing protein [Bacillus sp. C28GYM-DRY-1]